MPEMRQNHGMKFPMCLLAALMLGLGHTLAQEPQPDPRAIMKGARLAVALVKLDDGLTGQLRKGRSRTPVTVFLKGENIQFQFSENGKPWRIFHMRLGDEKCELFEFINQKQRAFDRDKLVQPIAGTDMTYEDLALRFFYWPDPQLIDVEEVKGQDCYRLRIAKPKGAAGNYEHVEVWVHTKFGAFMRIRGFDGKGTLIKEFQVEKVMQVDHQTWTLEKMQVSSHDPKDGRRTSITELTFDRPKEKLRPRGGLR